jgi:2-C-methyl-D-erythritol 2,4-cyclodiphosphate synthase
MRQTLAGVLGLPLEAVSVKATTTEHLGFVGREEGIAAQATCLLKHE